MTLIVAETHIAPSSLADAGTEYLVFFASKVDGRMWCGDCRAVDGLVQKTFGPEGPTALLVYVGDKPTWKSADNVFRGEPWKLKSVPTIIKLHDRQEIARLVEDEVQEHLASLVSGA